MEPDVIFEDEQVLAIAKPSGMIVYPDGIHDYPALSAWLESRYSQIYFPHRIDRETSGILLIARTQAMQDYLQQQFQERAVTKVYRAFVYGVIAEERGVIDRPIGNGRGGAGPRSSRAPHGTLREALTAYKVLGRTTEGPATYLEVYPKTGRTHQIRVHFSALQHPVVCDPLYAPSRPPLLGFERLALHALSLSFVHPTEGLLTLTDPLPKDFLAAERVLRGI